MKEAEVERLLRSTVLEAAPGRRARSWKVPVVAAGLLMAAAVLLAVLYPREGRRVADGQNRPRPAPVPEKPLRVLYVEGPPRYEYRFLKNALLRDPSVLLHTFVTIADEGFPQEHTKSEEPFFRGPLTEFPRDLRTLLEFDVLILGDVDPAKLGPGAEGRIARFVEEFGGGVLFISGMSHNPRSLAETALARLLPVVPENAGRPVDREGAPPDLAYRLTAEGVGSPITNFAEFKGDREKNRAKWEGPEGLQPVRWFERVKRLKPGAQGLVEIVEGGTAHPLFVTSYAGRGRVFWSATDETWLWRFLTGDSPWFHPFWRQAIRWAVQGKAQGARRYRISVDKEVYAAGERVLVFVTAYDAAFGPERADRIAAQAVDPDGKRIDLELMNDRARAGYYEGVYEPTGSGSYLIRVGDAPAVAEARFRVRGPDDDQ